jgi:hypothetical protein
MQQKKVSYVSKIPKEEFKRLIAEGYIHVTPDGHVTVLKPFSAKSSFVHESNTRRVQ